MSEPDSPYDPDELDDDEVDDEFLTPEGDFAEGMRAGDDERNGEEELIDEGGYGEHEERPQGVAGNVGAPLENGWFDPQQPGES